MFEKFGLINLYLSRILSILPSGFPSDINLFFAYNICFRFFVADDKLNHICVTKELNARADKDVFMLNFL